MCGRYTNKMTCSQIHALYKLTDQLHPRRPSWKMQPRYNIALTQTVDFVHLDKAGNLELNEGRWWLVPFFAKEVAKHALFNDHIEAIYKIGRLPRRLRVTATPDTSRQLFLVDHE